MSVAELAAASLEGHVEDGQRRIGLACPQQRDGVPDMAAQELLGLLGIGRHPGLDRLVHRYGVAPAPLRRDGHGQLAAGIVQGTGFGRRAGLLIDVEPRPRQSLGFGVPTLLHDDLNDETQYPAGLRRVTAALGQRAQERPTSLVLGFEQPSLPDQDAGHARVLLVDPRAFGLDGLRREGGRGLAIEAFGFGEVSRRRLHHAPGLGQRGVVAGELLGPLVLPAFRLVMEALDFAERGFSRFEIALASVREDQAAEQPDEPAALLEGNLGDGLLAQLYGAADIAGAPLGQAQLEEDFELGRAGVGADIGERLTQVLDLLLASADRPRIEPALVVEARELDWIGGCGWRLVGARQRALGYRGIGALLLIEDGGDVLDSAGRGDEGRRLGEFRGDLLGLLD